MLYLRVNSQFTRFNNLWFLGENENIQSYYKHLNRCLVQNVHVKHADMYVMSDIGEIWEIDRCLLKAAGRHHWNAGMKQVYGSH